MPLTTATKGTLAHTQPSFTSGASNTLLAANPNRTYLLIENNSGANIMVNLNGDALTGIVPTSTNKGIVITPNGSYESQPGACPIGAITGYQTSGATVNTVSLVEGT